MATPAPERGRRLGRGLDFLLSTPEPTSASSAAPSVEVDLDKLNSNPWQPRTEFSEETLASLADSIRQHGVIQPIAVRRKGDSYEIVSGERRVLAARRAGLRQVPAIVREVDDSQMLTIALVENLQREDLNPLERARALKRLAQDRGSSHEEVAQLAGLARSTVSNSIRLLELDSESLADLEGGQITEGHARALLAEPDLEQRRRLRAEIARSQMNVRSIEDKVHSNRSSASGKGRRAASEDARRLEKTLSEKLHARVRIFENGTRGRIVIPYPTLQEFERLFKALTGAPPPLE